MKLDNRSDPFATVVEVGLSVELVGFTCAAQGREVAVACLTARGNAIGRASETTLCQCPLCEVAVALQQQPCEMILKTQ